MSAVPFVDRLRAEFDASRARLPAEVLDPAGRGAALSRLAELGLPGLRDDDWRYTNLRPLHGLPLAPAANDATARRLPGPVATLPGATRLVFVDGRLDRGASSPLEGHPALRLLAGAAGTGAAARRDGAHRFALLNDIFATDALRLAVTGEAVIEAVFLSTGTGAGYPRMELELAPGARLTLVERHLGDQEFGSLVAPVLELRLSAGARCRACRLQDLGTEAVFLDTVHARLESRASLELVQLHLGAGTARTTLAVDLAGREAAAEVHAASAADASRSLDTQIRVAHNAPATLSRQELRAIATDRARIAFQSSVHVTAQAPGADSRQSLKGLIGGETAEINLRPQLEIDIDQVAASHGATTGALDENTLFYLLSRGLDRDTARLLLEWAFVETVLARIELPALRREVEERAVARLGNRAAREVLA